MRDHDTTEESAVQGRDVYTVSRLNDEVRAVLEGSFPPLWIEGELSNVARPASGHIYFSLKDDRCQVRCAMFRMRNRQLGFSPENGQHVLVRARVGLYPERGEFQLVAEYMEEAGAGALRRAFEALKQRLAAEGLFAAAHKQPLPGIPTRIGIITSPTGAAIRDILSVLARRFPAIPVLIYPVPVQGAGAAGDIARMLAIADERRECDVLILARGGGSLEDLWAFNEETLARAIYACRVPLVAGVGHEIDYTIADLVADQRAPTPSAAAELVTPDRAEWQAGISALTDRLLARVRAQLQDRRHALAWLGQRLEHPQRRLQNLLQRTDELSLRLGRAALAAPLHKHARLTALSARLHRHNPSVMLQAYRGRATELRQHLRSATREHLAGQRTRMVGLRRTLDALGPQRTLDRGYAIVTQRDSGEILRSADNAHAGEQVDARLASGTLLCTIDEVK